MEKFGREKVTWKAISRDPPWFFKMDPAKISTAKKTVKPFIPSSKKNCVANLCLSMIFRIQKWGLPMFDDPHGVNCPMLWSPSFSFLKFPENIEQNRFFIIDPDSGGMGETQGSWTTRFLFGDSQTVSIPLSLILECWEIFPELMRKTEADQKKFKLMVSIEVIDHLQREIKKSPSKRGAFSTSGRKLNNFNFYLLLLIRPLGNLSVCTLTILILRSELLLLSD